MRHQKHSNQLGVTKEHRTALMANLGVALIKEGRIQTTLKKAKALRPFAERLVTLAKKGGLANRRLAMARLRNEDAVTKLFNERVSEFTNRNGGYTRIYKLGPQRLGDGAEMALIEWVSAEDQGYRSSRRRGKGKAAAPVSEGKPAAEEKAAEEEVAPTEAEAKADDAAAASSDDQSSEEKKAE